MQNSNQTFIGEVASVTGSVVTVRLRDDMPSTLLLVDGESYRVGQIGGFARIPLGYTSLYGVCTQIGAAAAPANNPDKAAVSLATDPRIDNRWMTVTLFGESISRRFERGVSQYPTVGDTVHLVTPADMRTIYGDSAGDDSITVGEIAAASGVPARLRISPLVARHISVVGSTGAGKSNTVAVLLESIATGPFPSARCIVIDPHGEYGAAVGDDGYIFRINNTAGVTEDALYVPFWALPFNELRANLLGDLTPPTEAAVRDELLKLKLAAAKELSDPLEPNVITADSPIPFSVRKLWFVLDDYERQTFADNARITLTSRTQDGDAETLTSNVYPPPAAGSAAPFARGTGARNLSRPLELMRSRLQDSRYHFLFAPGLDFTPSLGGKTIADLDALVRKWVGHDRRITVFDLSNCPAEILCVVVGTLLRVIYDVLFWAGELPIAGFNQPLLVVLEEAHLFLPEGTETAAHRSITRIAKEGRKYGVGLCVVTQRPSEIDSTTLSQCGTMIALRLSNTADRGKVQNAMPDELAGLTSVLPALRTGEALVLGEAMPIPSRVRFKKARRKPVGDDPQLPQAWQTQRPDAELYKKAVSAWRNQIRAK
jgi:uncharacterized protein